MSKLEDLRLVRKLTRKELSAKSEVSTSSILRIERHGQRVRQSTILKLARALDVTEEELKTLLREHGNEKEAKHENMDGK